MGFTTPVFSGARSAGLAGACTAIGGDVHSLFYNPAGLARTRRIDAAIGFQHDKSSYQNIFYGNSNGADFSSTNLGHLAVAYPMPTYRGSVVAAFGIYRNYTSDLDLFYSGFNSSTNTLDNYVLQQSGSVFSYNAGFGVDLSPGLSVGASFFVLDGNLKALTQYSYIFPGPLVDGDLNKVFIDDDVETDLDGYGGRLGVQFHPLQEWYFGLAVMTPIWVGIDGDGITEEIDYYQNAPDSAFEETGFISTDYRLPFQINAGISYSPFNALLVSLDIAYADWSQATIDKSQIKLSSQNGTPRAPESVLREIVNFNAGVEITIPNTPLRLRGGYAYLPYPLKYLQADRIDNNDIQKAVIKNERQLFSMGAGSLIGKVLTMDFAFVYTTGERSIPTLKYDQTLKRFLLSASYRF